MERLQISDNRRFFVTESGKPFFWLADTAWELFHRLSPAEIEYYLDDRRSKGFNVIQAVILAELDGLHTPNYNGDLPLHNDDPAQPNEAYFQYVDAVIRLAASKDMYIGLLPTWGDKVDRLGGVGPVIFDEKSARLYGELLGNRYRNDPNIIWILGGDRHPNGYESIWSAMADGLRTGGDGRALMTYHPRGPGQSSTYLHNEDWLDFNLIQSGHNRRDEPNWDLITQDYQRTPVKPVIDAEPNYEGHPVGFERSGRFGYFTDFEVCKAAYRAVFAGACGHTYGHNSIWQMYAAGRKGLASPRMDWKEALTQPGANCMTHLRRLIESRPFLTRIPDQRFLASDPGPAVTHVRATVDLYGRYGMVYVPGARQTIDVRLDRLAARTVTAWWYSPRTGEADSIGDFADQSIASFTSPDCGPDWVLVLDDKSCAFSPPGTAGM